tara:strand:+ start:273 stop:458 length:186 start_codon:yes stop_codon:yes gene_type:complete
MALYELFTKEEHEKIEREYDSLKKKDLRKFAKEATAYYNKIKNTDNRITDFIIMVYLADKE